jgi:hypothetical protein
VLVDSAQLGLKLAGSQTVSEIHRIINLDHAPASYSYRSRASNPATSLGPGKTLDSRAGDDTVELLVPEIARLRSWFCKRLRRPRSGSPAREQRHQEQGGCETDRHTAGEADCHESVAEEPRLQGRRKSDRNRDNDRGTEEGKERMIHEK